MQLHQRAPVPTASGAQRPKARASRRSSVAVRAVAAPPRLVTKRSEEVRASDRAQVLSQWVFVLSAARLLLLRHRQGTIATHPTASLSNASSCTRTRLQIFLEAQDLLPGGVNSPVRAFKSVGGGPIVFDRVKGAYCFDVDANKYIDYVGTWGPAICGHANDEVNAALIKQIEKGTSFGAPCELEVRGAGMAGLGDGGAARAPLLLWPAAAGGGAALARRRP